LVAKLQSAADAMEKYEIYGDTLEKATKDKNHELLAQARTLLEGDTTILARTKELLLTKYPAAQQ
jgi:hypothetical protein